MDGKWSRDTLLSGQKTCHVGIELTDLAIGARNGHSITPWRVGGASYKMIALVGSKDEQRIALIDAIFCQAGEKCGEGVIV